MTRRRREHPSGLADLLEASGLGPRGGEPQRGGDRREAGVSHPGVPAPGAEVFRGVAPSDDEEVRCQRHHLPEQQEGEHAVRQDHQTHRQEKQWDDRTGGPPTGAVPSEGTVHRSDGTLRPVAETVDRRGNRHQADQDQVRGAQGVEAERKGRLGERRRQFQNGRAAGRETERRGPHPGQRASGRQEAGHAPGAIVLEQKRCGRRSDVGDGHDAQKPDHLEGRRHQRRGRRSSAFRMPRRMSSGSGGQPGTNRSTGITRSTPPTTA